MARRAKSEDAAIPAAGAAGPRGLRLGDHPRATRQIRTVRSWVALAGFAVVLLLSLRAHMPLEDALTRALEAGIVSFVLAWATMVVAWRQLAQAEIENARRRIVAALLELEAAERGGSAVG
ncbi:MAG: hypothetical protein JWN65_2104 [Solirubrobacterales bacterium]|jgi:cell division inhibitor SulA|nr:hypothetical protein [Solirubrobacterales bacterium]